MKVCNTDQLKRLNAWAATHYNRSLSDEGIEKLDPDGFHVLKLILVHEHVDGKKTDPHYRCMLTAKMRDSMEPAVAFIDLDPKAYARLADYESVMEAASEPQR